MSEGRKCNSETSLQSPMGPKDEAGADTDARVARGMSNESGWRIVFARTARAGGDSIVSRSAKPIMGRVGEVVSARGVSRSFSVGRDGELELLRATRAVSARMSIDEGVKLCEVESTTLLESMVVAGGIDWGSTPVIPVTLQGMVTIDLGTSEIAIWGMIMSPCIASCDGGAWINPCALCTAGKGGASKG